MKVAGLDVKLRMLEQFPPAAVSRYPYGDPWELVRGEDQGQVSGVARVHSLSLPKGAAMRYLAVSIAAFVLGGLVVPSLALSQPPTREPKLTATLESAFPDRTYILELPPRIPTTALSLTENGRPVSNLAIATRTGSAKGTYTISYRSLLPPQVRAVVSATIAGHRAATATATYTTPALHLSASSTAERRWLDSPHVTLLIIAASVALMAFGLLTRLKHRD